jgi:membrane protein DedA with SNARE-associated domain
MYLAFLWANRYVDLLLDFVASKAVLAPLLFLFIEEAGVPLPVPGDMIIAYTGYRLSLHPHGPGIWQAFFAAQVAALAGSTVLFFLSRRWGQEVIYKLGKFVFLKEAHIKRAEQLFAKYGILAIIVGRHLPGFRIPVTIFAATSGVKYTTFLASTFISTSAWILFYLIAGKQIGAHFRSQIQEYAAASVLVIVVVVVAIVLIHVIGLYREHHKNRQRAPSHKQDSNVDPKDK